MMDGSVSPNGVNQWIQWHHFSGGSLASIGWSLVVKPSCKMLLVSTGTLLNNLILGHPSLSINLFHSLIYVHAHKHETALYLTMYSPSGWPSWLGRMLGYVRSWVQILPLIKYSGLSGASCCGHGQHPKVWGPMESPKGFGWEVPPLSQKKKIIFDHVCISMIFLDCSKFSYNGQSIFIKKWCNRRN